MAASLSNASELPPRLSAERRERRLRSISFDSHAAGQVRCVGHIAFDEPHGVDAIDDVVERFRRRAVRRADNTLLLPESAYAPFTFMISPMLYMMHLR